MTGAAFSFRASKRGEVFVSHHSRVVVTLRGAVAADFVAQIDGASDEERQQLMARLTGNFKRGNERLAGDHRRNRR